MRVKYCDICSKDYSIMFRIQYKQQQTWVFVCEDCLVNIKRDNPHYRYGGTWKN
mgnify:CR=1 FL=1